MMNFKLLCVTLMSLAFASCYTELETVKQESSQEEDYSYQKDSYRQKEMNNDDTSSSSSTYYSQPRRYDDEYYYDRYRWYPRYRAYFSYYYPAYWPSFAFSISYGNPWYDPWYYGCNWYYDPWICGTPYVGYGWPVYYPPIYAYQFNPFSYYRYRTSYAGGYGSNIRTNRDFGSTRGGSGRTFGSGRGSGTGGYYLPSGGSIEQPSGRNRRGEVSSSVNSSRVRGGRGERIREDRSRNREPNTQGDRRDDRRGERRSEEVRSRDVRYSDAPPEPVLREGARGRYEGSEPRRMGSRRSGDGSAQAPPSYSPPPSSPPPTYSPPPSRGGGSSGGGGEQRSGGRSGGRR